MVLMKSIVFNYKSVIDQLSLNESKIVIIVTPKIVPYFLLELVLFTFYLVRNNTRKTPNKKRKSIGNTLSLRKLSLYDKCFVVTYSNILMN